MAGRPARQAKVEKRDGRIVPFDPRKIELAIAKAFQATGEGDADLARELAGVVAMALGRRRGGKAEKKYPTIEEIQDLVERVLMETGFIKTAKAYILYRDKRTRIRQMVSVRNSGAESKLRVDLTHGSVPWSKGRIAAALIQEADLPRETAEQVASRVEKKVFQSGMTRLTTALIRELVDCELFELGLETQRRRQAPIGIPKYNLGQLLKTGFLEEDGHPFGSAGDPALLASRQMIRKFALEEILSGVPGQAHRSGEIHFADLSRVDLEFASWVRLDHWNLPAVPGCPPGSSLAGQAAAAASYLVDQTSSLVILDGVDGLAARSGKPNEFARDLEARLQVLADSGDRARLALSDFTRVKMALPRIQGIPFAGQVFSGPGLSRIPGEKTGLIACGAIGALNLPRIAFRTGKWMDGQFLARVARGLEIVCEGLVALHAFQDQVRACRRADHPPARISYAVMLEGVAEAMDFCRDGKEDPEWEKTLAVTARDFLEDFSIRSGLPVLLDPRGYSPAAARFARLDGELFPGKGLEPAGAPHSYHGFSPTLVSSIVHEDPA